MSVILSPQRLRFSPALLTSAAAVAVCRTLRERGFDIGIKWVNDLHARGKKICGILTEAVSNGSEILGYVIGIGLNLGKDDFPEELKEIAGSLPIPLTERIALLTEILKNLDLSLSESVPDMIAYLTKYSVVLGKQIRFFGAAEGEGVAVALDENGGLIVQTAEGNRLTLTTGEISVRLQNKPSPS